MVNSHRAPDEDVQQTVEAVDDISALHGTGDPGLRGDGQPPRTRLANENGGQFVRMMTTRVPAKND